MSSSGGENNGEWSSEETEEDHLYSKKKKKKLKQSLSPSAPSESSPHSIPPCRKDESSGGSGKRKHNGKSDTARSDQQTGANNGVPATKRRKTTWPEDESRLKMLGPLHLPDLLEVPRVPINDRESQDLNQRLAAIKRRLRSREERSRSSSPATPGATNSNERQRLIEEKQAIIEELILKNPTFNPPSDGTNPSKKKKLFKMKLYLPAKRFPCYNFVGLIIGPRGRTQKRLEMETGARIQLRGRGCQRKNSRQEEEDPHVLVEADNQRSLDAAAAMVEKLLVPVAEGWNVLKRAQLRELATLNHAQHCRLPAHGHF